MPNRVIRESILDSERYWSCTIEARELYRHLQLLADDLGCVSLAPVMLRRRCFDSAPSQDKISNLIQQLADADLIRIYVVGEPVDNFSAKFAFIPRFGQRLRIMRLKHPMPPQALLVNDPEAIEKFSKIKGNSVNLTDICLTHDRHMSAESNRIEKKGKESDTASQDQRAEKKADDGPTPIKNFFQLQNPNPKPETKPNAKPETRPSPPKAAHGLTPRQAAEAAVRGEK